MTKEKAAKVIQKLKARMDDPASVEAEKELCAKRIKELTDEFGIVETDFKDGLDPSLSELNIKSSARHVDALVQNIIIPFENDSIVVTDFGGTILIGPKEFVGMVDRICKVILPSYEHSFRLFSVSLTQKLNKLETNPVKRDRVFKRAEDAWVFGYVQTIQWLMANYVNEKKYQAETAAYRASKPSLSEDKTAVKPKAPPVYTNRSLTISNVEMPTPQKIKKYLYSKYNIDLESPVEEMSEIEIERETNELNKLNEIVFMGRAAASRISLNAITEAADEKEDA